MTLADLRGYTRSERLLQRLPVSLIEHPFESLMAAWGLISGPPILLGIASPTSINSLLPPWGRLLWGVMLTVGACTIAWGLRRHRPASTVVRGLRLLGAACLIYALAILTVVGLADGIPGGPLLTAIGALCYLRAWWLCKLADINAQIAESRRLTERAIECSEQANENRTTG